MQPSEDPALLRALAEQISDAPVLIGELPPDLPLDLPMPPGAVVLGSVVHPGFRHPMQPDVELHPGHAQVFLRAPGSPTELSAFYVEICRAQGWVIPGAPGPAARFMTPGQADAAAHLNCSDPDGRYLQAVIRTRPDNQCDIRLHLGTAPRAIQDSSQNMMLMLGRLFGRENGPGFSITPTGGHGSDHTASAEARATGDVKAPALAEWLAEKCRAAGWTRLSGDAGPEVAWSRWTIPSNSPDEDTYDGWLIVMVGPGPGNATIEARAQRSSRGGGMFGGQHMSSSFSSRLTGVVVSTTPLASPLRTWARQGQDAPKPWPRDGATIACPRCGFRPGAESTWMCFPDCGAQWNTFNTRGRCPGCGKQWTETACLSCGVMSPHEDWYRNDRPSGGSTGRTDAPGHPGPSGPRSPR